METKEIYRPANIEFDTDGGAMPMNMGTAFIDAQNAIQFMAKYVMSVNSKVRASRFMDNFEKNEIRKEYQELLEQKIPMLERELMKAKSAYDEAKKALADATELVSATTNETKALASEVRRGVREMELDDINTWRVPVGNKYYFYTFIDNQIKLAKVQDIPFHEKSELFNAMNRNEDFFARYYPGGLINMAAFEDETQETTAPASSTGSEEPEEGDDCE